MVIYIEILNLNFIFSNDRISKIGIFSISEINLYIGKKYLHRSEIMTTKVTIISGFLGAGKTTYLKKVLPHIKGTIAVIENEFGNVGIDGETLKGEIPIREIFAGCICCSVAGDLKNAITDLVSSYTPDHIIIEPSGVGNLSEIVKVIELIKKKGNQPIEIHNLITVVDASGYDEYSEDFGMFYLDQIKHANSILLSHIDNLDESKVAEVSEKLKDINQSANIIESEWISIDGEILAEMTESEFSIGSHINQGIETVPADKIFSAVSINPSKAVSRLEIESLLRNLKDCQSGRVLRAKGIVDLLDGGQIRFNFTPFDTKLDHINEYLEPKAVVIGAKIDKNEILKIFSI